VDGSTPVPTRFLTRMYVPVFSASGLVFLGASIWAFRRFLVLDWWYPLFMAIYFALFGAWLVAMFPGRKRPILEITREEIRYGTAGWPWRHSIRIDEVVEVGEPSGFWPVLPLRLRSGKRIRLRLGEIRTAERAAALAAIKAAVTTARTAPGSAQ
jgi:hypothetical protein